MQLADRVLAVNPSVVSADLEGEMVLLDVDTGVYFGLDEVGSSIWKLIQRALPESGILSHLLDEYDVDPGTLKDDVADFLDLLRRRNLIVSDGI